MQRLSTPWEELSGRYGIPFLQADFKKRDGFKRSLELSRMYGFYRQDYCGCVWSREERKKDSMWKAPNDACSASRRCDYPS